LGARAARAPSRCCFPACIRSSRRTPTSTMTERVVGHPADARFHRRSGSPVARARRVELIRSASDPSAGSDERFSRNGRVSVQRGAAARCAAPRLGTNVVGVDEWPRVLAGRLGAAPLLGLPRFGWRRETRNLDPELAPVACGQFFGLRIEWLTRDRAHGTEATPGHRLTNARLQCVAARAKR